MYCQKCEVIVSTSFGDEEKLKGLLKAAIIEVLEERGDLLREALEEALEEIALVRAIEAAEDSPSVSREEVFAILEGES